MVDTITPQKLNKTAFFFSISSSVSSHGCVLLPRVAAATERFCSDKRGKLCPLTSLPELVLPLSLQPFTGTSHKHSLCFHMLMLLLNVSFHTKYVNVCMVTSTLSATSYSTLKIKLKKPHENHFNFARAI